MLVILVMLLTVELGFLIWKSDAIITIAITTTITVIAHCGVKIVESVVCTVCVGGDDRSGGSEEVVLCNGGPREQDGRLGMG